MRTRLLVGSQQYGMDMFLMTREKDKQDTYIDIRSACSCLEQVKQYIQFVTDNIVCPTLRLFPSSGRIMTLQMPSTYRGSGDINVLAHGCNDLGIGKEIKNRLQRWIDQHED